MNRTEAALLCRYVAECCPQQKFGGHTPDAWHDLLGDLPFRIAKLAATTVAKRQPFVAPSEIRTTVSQLRRIARNTLGGHLDDSRPPADPGDYLAWVQARRDQVNALADEALTGGALDLTRINLDDDDETAPVVTAKLPPALTAGPNRTRPDSATSDPERVARILRDAMPRQVAASTAGTADQHQDVDEEAIAAERARQLAELDARIAADGGRQEAEESDPHGEDGAR